MNQLVERYPKALAAIVLFGIIVAVYFRLLPTLPTIMQDELFYMIQTRHTDQSDIQLSNYLFTWLYQLTLFGGVDYYWLVKLINFVFLFGFGFIVFLLARQFLSFWLALLFSGVSVAGPISLYGSVFMPEAMYIFFAALSFYLVLRINLGIQRASLVSTLVAALALSLTSLVKPHALFLLLGFVLFLLFGSKWRVISFRQRLGIATLFGASTVLLKLAGGFVLAGPSGLTLFGGYGSLTGIFGRLLEFLGLTLDTEVSVTDQETSAASPASSELSFLEVSIQQFGLHFLAIGFLLAVASITSGGEVSCFYTKCPVETLGFKQ